MPICFAPSILPLSRTFFTPSTTAPRPPRSPPSSPLFAMSSAAPSSSSSSAAAAAAATASASPAPPTDPAAIRAVMNTSTHSTLQTSKAGALSSYAPATRLIHAGSHPSEYSTDPLGRSVVNVPVYRASTVTFPSQATLRASAVDYPFTGMWYGRHGNPTTFALEESFAVLEGGVNACLTSSGVAAMNAALLAFVKAGDHVLVTDAVYDPTRSFCDAFLSRFGVATTYFSPTLSPDAFRALIQPNTVACVVESPASLSFEVMDIAAIAAEARAKGVKVICDNTYGPGLFRPLENGCDISLNAATKYIGGHSDLMMGIAAAGDADTYRLLKKSVAALGCPPGTDDAYMALRGMKSLGVRVKQHGINGLTLASWLETRPEVKRVMHPGLESHPQHELFKRQFSGPCGLFTMQLVEGFSRKAVDDMLDGLKLFGVGFSWGGYESLVLPCSINSCRTVDTWKYGDGYGQTIRIHAGLEDADDLLADLEEGFGRLNSHPKVE